jgi:hypothetical protein
VISEPTLQNVALDTALWGLALPPLLAAFAAFAVALREEREGAAELRRAAARRRVAHLATIASALSLALVVSRVARIADMPVGGRVLADHVLRLVRIGSFDANLDLTFDPVAAVACLALTTAGIVALGLGARGGSERAAQSTGALSLGVAALLLAFLAADAIVLAAALDLAVLALAFATARQARLTRVALVGGAIAMSGAAIVFWGLGGGWAGGDYTVDFSPRVSALRDSAPSDDDDDDVRPGTTPGAALLTLVGHPGAVVFFDDARTPILDGDHALRAPFVRHAVSAGRHSIRVHSGAGADDFVIPDAIASAGEETTIAWVGPTWSFREMRDSLGIRDARGGSPIREAFLARVLTSGVRLSDAACVLWLLGASLLAWAVGDAARRRGAGVLGDAALLTIVWYVAARFDPFLALAPMGRCVLALVASATFMAAARDARRGGRVAPALASLVLLGASVRAAPSGAIVVLAATLALSSAALSRDGAPGRVANGALVGMPVPLVGVAWGAFGIVDAAWTTPPGGRVVGAAIVAASLVGAFLLGASARRSAEVGDDVETRALPRTSLAMAIVAAALGPLLGASRGWLGERGTAAASVLLDPFVAGWANGGRSHEVAIALAWTGATFGGFAYAKRRANAARGVERAAVDDDVTGFARAGLDLVLGFDRWVVGGTMGGLVNGARVVGWSLTRGVDAVLQAPGNAAARVLSRGARRSGATRAALIVAGGATFALVVWAAR